MCESTVGRWGYEAWDATFGVWLPRQTRYTTRQEIERVTALYDAFGCVARVIDYSPPKVVVKMEGTDNVSLSD